MTVQLTTYKSEQSFSEGKNALVFNHIHKCAGTSFLHMLKTQFGPCYYDATYLGSWRELHERLTTEERPRIAIGGHTAWGMHQMLPPAYHIFYITILRHPLQRFASAYRFGRSRYALWTSMQDFMQGYKHNFLVGWLGNGSIELARERLLNGYYMFGLIDHFDDFCSLLFKRLDLDPPESVAQNVTPLAEDDIEPDEEHAFRERNALDIEFYDWAEKLFLKRHGETLVTTPHNEPSASPKKESAAFSFETRELLDQGRLDDAIRHIETQEDLTSSHHIYLAALYRDVGEPDKARAAYAKAREMDIESVRWQARYLRETNPEAAIHALTKALETFFPIYSDIPDSYLNRFRQEVTLLLADTMADLHPFEKAGKYYRAAFEINPQTWSALSAYVRFLCAMREYDKAYHILYPVITRPDRFGTTLYDAMDLLLGHFTTPGAHPFVCQLIENHIIRQWSLLRTHPNGYRRTAMLFGAGKHTAWLEMMTKNVDGPDVRLILDDRAPVIDPVWNLFPLPPSMWRPNEDDTIILSTDCAIEEMTARCRDLYGPDVELINLYEGLPPGPYPKRTREEITAVDGNTVPAQAASRRED